MTRTETIKYPNTKGRTRWTRHHDCGCQVRDTTVKPVASANIYAWDRGWVVCDRTGCKDGNPPVRVVHYPVKSAYAAWELYRFDYLNAK